MAVFTNDPLRTKGAIETEDHSQAGNLGLAGQLGHRDQDPMLKAADTDFPEPGENPEHSGWQKKPRKKPKIIAKKPKRTVSA